VRNYGDFQKSLTIPVSPFRTTEGHWNQHRSVGRPRVPISVP